MSRPQPARARVLATLLATLLASALGLAACSSGGDGASSQQSSSPTPATTTEAAPPEPSPPPATPEVGACYQLSYDEAVAPTNDDTPVPCSRPHTTQTFAIGKLDLVQNGHLLAVDSKAVQQQIARACPRRLPDFLGGTDEQLRLTLLRPVWFTPTIEESDAGASWYRCDVIVVGGDRLVAKVRGGLADVLTEPDARADLEMCGTAQPGTQAFTRVLCREDHTWKAISVLDLSDLAKGRKKTYPGQKAVQAAGADACPAAARAIASNALDYEWGYEWPTQDQWRAGQVYGRCWSPDPP